MASSKPASPVCLIVIDGWGVSDEVNGNAIANAETPVMDGLAKNEGQYVTLDASGLSVGLPDGLMGNSEVGHLNIGAGRVIYQDIVRINLDVESKAIFQNANFVQACNRAKSLNGRLLLLGLVSDGGVHAHINHLFALLEGAKANSVPKTFVHFFSDGRDTSPTSGAGFVQAVLDKTTELGYGSLATIMGRYYAMDRDKRWERIQIAVEGLVEGVGEKTTPKEVVNVVKKNYANDITDEFLKPIIVDSEGLIQENDTLIFIDYRADRMRQITETLGIQQHYENPKVLPKNIEIFSMTEYKKEFPFKSLYPPTVPKNVLAEVVSNAGWPQFHTAETEKYAHVTFFFNGGQEKAFPGEDRLLVPSPKVATYDLQPEMNCAGVGEEVAKAVASKKYAFVMCNFAPPDMVGHTGKYEPAVKACTATDKAIGVIKKACEDNGYVLLITADHGNAEQMYDPKGGPLTSHTTNRVPFCMYNTDRKFSVPPSYNAALCDVAPTVLDLLGTAIPTADITGKSLLQ